MKTRHTLASLAITCTLVILMGSMAPQDALAGSSKNSFVGSWTVFGSPSSPGAPTFSNLGTIHRDGTIVNSDPVFGSGHGAWKRVGARQYKVRFLTLVPPNDPFFPPNAVITVTGVITLHRGGNTASGPFQTTFEDEDGNLLFTSEGTVAFTRIRLN